MDGTLIDSELLAAEVVREFCKKRNFTLSAADEHEVVGKTWQKAVEILASKYDVKLPARDIVDVMVQEYRKLLKQKVIPIPGVIDAVKAFSQKVPLAVVSGSVRAHIEFVLDKMQISKYFTFILGMEDYPRSKPSPDPYLLAIQKMQIKSEHGLVFEDSLPGILSAQAAGLWVVAIEAANHFQQDQSLAHAKIPDFRNCTLESLKNLIR